MNEPTDKVLKGKRISKRLFLKLKLKLKNNHNRLSAHLAAGRAMKLNLASIRSYSPIRGQVENAPYSPHLYGFFWQQLEAEKHLSCKSFLNLSVLQALLPRLDAEDLDLGIYELGHFCRYSHSTNLFFPLLRTTLGRNISTNHHSAVLEPWLWTTTHRDSTVRTQLKEVLYGHKVSEWSRLTLQHRLSYPLVRRLYHKHWRLRQYWLPFPFLRTTSRLQFGGSFENFPLSGFLTQPQTQLINKSTFFALTTRWLPLWAVVGGRLGRLQRGFLLHTYPRSNVLATQRMVQWELAPVVAYREKNRLFAGVRRNPPISSQHGFLIGNSNPLWFRYVTSEPIVLNFITKVNTSGGSQVMSQNITRTVSFDNMNKMSSSFTNILPTPFFNFWLRRRVLRLLLHLGRFSPNVSMWYYQTLVRFVEVATGKRAYIKFNPFVENVLTVRDLALCTLWELRVQSFQKMLGPRIFLNESLRIIYLAVKLKDSRFLMNWIIAMLDRLSFWKSKTIFRYLKYVVRVLLAPHFQTLGFQGFKLKLKGKISVAGNARTRTLFYRVGRTSHATLTSRLSYSFDLVQTFTGVMGFHLWFFFIRI